MDKLSTLFLIIWIIGVLYLIASAVFSRACDPDEILEEVLEE